MFTIEDARHRVQGPNSCRRVVGGDAGLPVRIERGPKMPLAVCTRLGCLGRRELLFAQAHLHGRIACARCDAVDRRNSLLGGTEGTFHLLGD